MPLSFLPNNAFPLPAPLTPILVALGLDNKTAATISKVYLSSALTLKETYETEYIHACSAIIVTSDDRGHSSKELRSKLLTVAITRYTQATLKWGDETIRKAKASLLGRNKKSTSQPKVKPTVPPSTEPGREGTFGLKERVNVSKHTPFSTNNPPHAFPRSYPPPVRPESISFVTHIPLLDRRSRCRPSAASDSDLDACTDALSRLSLGPPSPQSKSSHKPSKTVPKSRFHARTVSTPKLTSQLSPSRPRIVLPTLDTSVAVSHKPLSKNTPSYTPPTIAPHTQNIDIPRSNYRKVSSIPYRRPSIHSSTSPESPLSSSLSRSIRRTPSLTSDHGSEASSPSTPPDFSPMHTPAPTLSRKGSFPETLSRFGDSPIYYYGGGHGTDCGTNIYG